MIPRRPPKPPDPNAALRRQLALKKLAAALRSRIALPAQASGQTARDPRVDQLLQNEQSNNLGVTAAGAKVLDVATTGLGVTGILSITNTGSAAANAATFFEASLANGNSFALRLGKADTGASDGLGLLLRAERDGGEQQGLHRHLRTDRYALRGRQRKGDHRNLWHRYRRH
jgi:type IV secretory pathway VirB2 component (pilin)